MIRSSFKNPRGRVAALLLLAATGVAVAQVIPTGPDELPAETEAPPRYRVEVIIFEYAEDVAVGTERFAPKPYSRPSAAIDDDAAADNPEVTPPPAVEQQPPEVPPARRFVLEILEEDELGMQNIYRMLERVDVYEPLMHVGWTQTAVPEPDTPELRLDRLGPVPEGLDGTLQLYLSRFVHLVVDVSLDAKPEPVSDDRGRFQPIAPAGEYGDGRTFAQRQDDSIDLLYQPLRYRIRDDRIMKSGDTRYYDHPRFGVIARVTLVEEEEAAGLPDEPDSG